MTAKNELTIVRMLDAPRAKVWRACTEVEGLKQWWGMPRNATMPTCKVDFRLGGSMLCEIAMQGQEPLWFVWLYREIVPNQKLVLEQHASDAAGRALDTPERPVSMVTLMLEDVNGKTKLTVTHTGMASHVYRVEDFKEGWSQSLDRLDKQLTASSHL